MNAFRGHLASIWDSGDILDSVWRILSSPRTTALLLALATAATCLTVIFPQRPTEALTDPSANSQWLAIVHERYGGVSDWLVRAGIVGIVRSPWYRGLLAMLATSLLTGAISLIWPAQLHLASSEVIRLGSGGAVDAPDTYLEQASRILQECHFRVVAGHNQGVMYADRYIWPSVLVRFSLLLILCGSVISERSAWWEENFLLRPGEIRALGHETDLAASSRVLDQPGTGQAVGHEATELILYRDNVPVWRTILPGRLPAFGAGLLFYRTSTEPALLLRAEDATGETLGLQTPETGTTEFREVALRFLKDESPRYIVALGVAPGSTLTRQFQQRGNERYVLVPSRNLALRVICRGSLSDASNALFELEVFRESEAVPLRQMQFEVKSVLSLDDAYFEFEPQRYAVLRFGHDNGLALALLGAVGLLVGLAFCIWRPAQRLALIAEVTSGHLNLLLAQPHLLIRRGTTWLENFAQSLAATLNLDVQGQSEVHPSLFPTSLPTDPPCSGVS